MSPIQRVLPEDADLSDENFARLNRDFYQASPHEYSRTG